MSTDVIKDFISYSKFKPVRYILDTKGVNVTRDAYDRVIKIADVSGNGRHFSCGTDQFPTLKTWGLDISKNAEFGGSALVHKIYSRYVCDIEADTKCVNFVNNKYITLDPSILTSLTNEITIVAKVIGDPNWSMNTTFLRAEGPSSARYINIHLPWSDNKIYFDCGGTSSSSYDRLTVTMPDIPTSKRIINTYVFTKNVVTGVMNIYANGILIATSTGNTRAINLDPTSKFRLGEDWTGRLVHFSMYSREFTQSDVDNLPPSSDPSTLVYYNCQEDITSSIVNDSSSNLRHSSITYKSSPPTGLIYSLGADGKGYSAVMYGEDVLETASNEAPLSQGYTVSMYVKCSGKDMMLFSRGQDLNSGIVATVNYLGRIRVVFRTGSGSYIERSGSINITDNTWHHIVVSINLTNLLIVVDGSTAYDSTHGATIGDCIGKTVIGGSFITKYSGVNNYTVTPAIFYGNMDNVSITNSFLTFKDCITLGRRSTYANDKVYIPTKTFINMLQSKRAITNNGILGSVIAVIEITDSSSAPTLLESIGRTFSVRARQHYYYDRPGFTKYNVSDYLDPDTTHVVPYNTKIILSFTMSITTSMSIRVNNKQRSYIGISSSYLPVDALGDLGGNIYKLIAFDSPLTDAEELYYINNLMNEYGVV